MNTHTSPMKPPRSERDTAATETTCACPPSSTGGSKSKRNFFVDVVTAVVFASMVGTGILLAWVLPPGRFGGRGLVWLGLDRHAWGEVHLWLAFAVLGLIVTHVVQHWNWVKVCWTRCLGTWRSLRTWAVVTVMSVLMFLPLVVPTSASKAGPGNGWGRGRALRSAVDGSAEIHRPRGGGRWSEHGKGRGLRCGDGTAARGEDLATLQQATGSNLPWKKRSREGS